ncbi:hypothetical protein CI238_09674 [Colletotrichum incanum]|uniref:Uncharacterized protein n=1 Tax=Colletotrichum incanum TaxID=1573173 RepID=A0A161W7R4_COLIC|nr:hypothetical protein CI238_09674 [Colletotrichum incanum]
MESSLSNSVATTKLGQPTGVANDVTKRGGPNSSPQSPPALLKSIYVGSIILALITPLIGTGIAPLPTRQPHHPPRNVPASPLRVSLDRRSLLLGISPLLRLLVKTFLSTTSTIPSSSASFASTTSIYSLRCRGVKPLWLTTLRLYRVKAEQQLRLNSAKPL